MLKAAKCFVGCQGLRSESRTAPVCRRRDWVMMRRVVGSAHDLFRVDVFATVANDLESVPRRLFQFPQVPAALCSGNRMTK